MLLQYYAEDAFGEHRPYGRGSCRELETQGDLHKLTNGIVSERHLILRWLASKFMQFEKGLSAIMAGLEQFRRQKGGHCVPEHISFPSR